MLERTNRGIIHKFFRSTAIGVSVSLQATTLSKVQVPSQQAGHRRVESPVKRGWPYSIWRTEPSPVFFGVAPARFRVGSSAATPRVTGQFDLHKNMAQQTSRLRMPRPDEFVDSNLSKYVFDCSFQSGVRFIHALTLSFLSRLQFDAYLNFVPIQCTAYNLLEWILRHIRVDYFPFQSPILLSLSSDWHSR